MCRTSPKVLHDRCWIAYAIGTVAAAAFAAVLYTVVSGESVVTALTDLVTRALSTTF